MEFIKTGPEETPVGYGPRIWIKFPHHPATSKNPDVAGVFSAMERLCAWHGHDRSYRKEANEANDWNPPIVLSWEFPSVRPGSEFGHQWFEALEALKAYNVTEISDREGQIRFLDDFKENLS